MKKNSIQSAKKDAISENCPFLCDEDCASFCENFEGPFTYNSGKNGEGEEKTITCKKLSRQDEKKQNNKCKKDEVFENCPGVCIDNCPFPKFSCVNFSGSFTFKSGKGGNGKEKTTTCEKVASKDTNSIINKCKKIEIETNCPAVCDETCFPSCENVPGSFEYKNNGEFELITCEEAAEDADKKCKKGVIADNCPGVCDAECA